jgi:RimJ/RimL family protein N-acetyltransferase
VALELVAARPAHFTWLAEASDAPGPAGLDAAPGGIESAQVLELLARIAAGLDTAGVEGSFLIVVDSEVVGLCGFKRVPSAGEVDIGYGIAPSRRRRGYATAAVAALVSRVARSAGLHALVAETIPENVASHRVLRRNAFVQSGERMDAEDGLVQVWRRSLN